MGVYKNNSSLTQEEKEKRFNNFLNKTIILSSKRFFKKEVNISNKEQMLVDDNSQTSVLNSIVNSTTSEFDLVENCFELNNALNKLSDIEQTVIFLLYNKELSQDEASKILEICSKSVSRIKIRAINKLRKYMKGDKIYQFMN